MKAFFIFLLTSFFILNTYSQEKSDTSIYEFIDEWPQRDTSFIKTYTLKDNMIVREEYFGHSFDLSSITLVTMDTFVVYKDRWEKFYNGRLYPYFSLAAFTEKIVLVEKGKWDEKKDVSCKYNPVDKQIVNGDLILAYDMDVYYGKYAKYTGARIYFSFKYGIVGYLNMSQPVQMILKPFKGSLKMEYRPRNSEIN